MHDLGSAVGAILRRERYVSARRLDSTVGPPEKVSVGARE
jgi:hypothetical protein